MKKSAPCDKCDHSMNEHVTMTKNGSEIGKCRICGCETAIMPMVTRTIPVPTVKSGRRTLRKIGLAMGIMFAAFIVLDLVGSTMVADDMQETRTEETRTEETRTQTSISEPVYDKPISILLPQGDEIGTEWRKSEPDNAVLESEGFYEGLQQSFNKGSQFERTVLTISIYRFDASDDAFNYKNNIVSALIEEGGFEEMSIDPTFDADCYGTYQELTLNDKVEIYCAKDNIYFKTRVVGPPSIFVGIEDDAKHFSSVIAEKI